MSASPENHSSYEFGEFRIDRLDRVLMKDGRLVPLTPKVFDLLLLLIENHGHVVGKDRLMSEVWPDTFVEEGNLTQNISVLRKALGEKRYIQTIPRRGYRFVGDIRLVGEDHEEVIIQEHSRSRILISESDVAESLLPPAEPILLPAARRGFFTRRNVVPLATGLMALIVVGIIWNSSRKAEPPVPRPQIKTIAVLPFKPLSNEGREEYLELGIADALITRLSNIRQILVRPTSSVRKFAGTSYDPIVAGRELKADAVIDGNIQRLGDRVRINVQLIRISDGSVLWGYHCDDLCTDLFTAQDSISENVAHALTLTLTDVEGQALTKRYTNNPEAYQLYLKGRFYWNKRTEDGIEKGIEHFQLAIEKDPTYALAYVGLADCYAVLQGYSSRSSQEFYPKAEAAARKALELDDTLAEAHASLAFCFLAYDWNLAESEREFRRTIELNPNYATAHQWYGNSLLSVQGRFDEAISEGKQALELDPVSLVINMDLGDIFIYARQYDKAVEQLQKTVEMDPNWYSAHLGLGLAYESKDSFPEAIAEYQKATQLNDDPYALAYLGHAYGASGNSESALKVLDQLKEIAKRRNVSAFSFALVYAGLGQRDQAVQWLEQSYQDRAFADVGYIKVDPRFDSLHSDPRFAELLRAMGFRP
jgi:DNA-binding winged helix-turn-helix (wHTH) protein/TolB-like protein/Flp pilus assembly protein TadD